MMSLRLLLLVSAVALVSCDSEGSELIGTVHEVSCSGALTEIGGEQFDFRTVNNCGNGLVEYNATLTSESGNVDARFRIGCGARFCIGGVRVVEWSTN